MNAVAVSCFATLLFVFLVLCEPHLLREEITMVATSRAATQKKRDFVVILLNAMIIHLSAHPIPAIKLEFLHTHKKRRCPYQLVRNSDSSDEYCCERAERHLRRMINTRKVCNKGWRPLHTPGMWYHTRKHHFWHCCWQQFWISEVPNSQKQSINDASQYVCWLIAFLRIMRSYAYNLTQS